MNAQAVALKKSNFEVELENYEPQIAAALPGHVSPEKFRRVVMTAVARQPELYTEADRRTLFNSCVQCASDGLLPDNREAALVIFKTKDRRTDQWVKAVQYMPMIAGILKRMRNTGEVASADSQVIYQNDHFDYQLGDEAHITHKPTMGDPGPIIGAYAIIKLTNGEVLREVMLRSQIDQARAVSRSGDKENSPWSKWYGEMARKTVLRRCAKRAPVSPDLERLLSRDDAPEPPTSLPPPRPTRHSIAAPIEPEHEVDPAAAGHEDLDQKFRETVADEPAAAEEKVDAETGEVTEAELPLAEPEPYDPSKECEKLWDGAMAQTKKGERTQYWAMQREEGAAGYVLYQKAPDLYNELAKKILASIKDLPA
jgi:recombination protein RecT